MIERILLSSAINSLSRKDSVKVAKGCQAVGVRTLAMTLSVEIYFVVSVIAQISIQVKYTSTLEPKEDLNLM